MFNNSDNFAARQEAIDDGALLATYKLASQVHELPAKQAVRRYVPKPGKLYDCPPDKRAALVADLRALALLGSGYAPILARGKFPAGKAWQSGEITPATLGARRQGHPEAVNIGLLTGALVAIDIDVRDPAHVRRFVDCIHTELGATGLHRRGAKGELLVYRNPSPIGKITISYAAVDKKSEPVRAPLIEFLGEGQQFIAFGQHPDGMMYRWVECDPDLEILSEHTPLTVPFADVPEASGDALGALATKLVTLAERLGFKDVRLSSRGEKREGAGPYVGTPVSGENLVAWLSLRKDGKAVFDPNSDYTTWRDIVAPVGNAIVTGSLSGPEIACAWSRGDYHRDMYPNGVPLYDKPDQFGRVGDDVVNFVIDTLPPKEGGRNIGSIIKQAQDAGWQGNPHDDGKPAREAFEGANLPPPRDERNEKPKQSRFEPIDLIAAERAPPPTYWDKGCIFIRAEEGASMMLSAVKGAHKTGVTMTSCIDFVLHSGARVAYHLGEAPQDAGRSRVPAICEHFGSSVAALAATKRFRLIPAVPMLQEGADLNEAVAKVADLKPNIVVIDTTARGLMDSSNKDDVMIRAIRAGEKFKEKYNCLVVLIGHFGKDESRGTRGAQTGEDAADIVVYLTKKGDTVFAFMKNNRLGRDDYTVAFDVKSYTKLGHYEHVPVLVYRGQTAGPTDLGKQEVIREVRANRRLVAEKLEELGMYDEDHSIPLRKLAEELTGAAPDKNTNVAKYQRWETDVGRWEVILRKGTAERQRTNRKKVTPAPLDGLFFRAGRTLGESTRDTRPIRFYKSQHYMLPDLAVDEQNIEKGD